jgi:ribosomal protein S18 acetylase RimI-like enzyme
MTVEFRPSSEFSLAELAAVFTASYHGYFIPLVVDETQLRYMVGVFDLDLSRSVVAVQRERPIGLANLGRRGERTWLGGVGVLPDHRGSGIGESPTRMLLDQAREARAREMVLEVIVENSPAIALYEKLGFARTRELEVLSLAAANEQSEARETIGSVWRRLRHLHFLPRLARSARAERRPGCGEAVAGTALPGRSRGAGRARGVRGRSRHGWGEDGRGQRAQWAEPGPTPAELVACLERHPVDVPSGVKEAPDTLKQWLVGVMDQPSVSSAVEDCTAGPPPNGQKK